MFPLRDENPQILTPFITYGLIVANLYAWFSLQGMGRGDAFLGSLCTYGLIPGELFGLVEPGTLIPLDGFSVCRLEGQARPETIFTSMFMHGSWFHLIGNLWFLFLFGNNIEDAMGHFRFLIFYLLTGFVAAAAQIVAAPTSVIPMVGASGAISGVMGAYILLYPRVRVVMLVIIVIFITTIRVPAAIVLGYWFMLQLLGGLFIPSDGGGVAFFAHAGGFLAGMFLVRHFKNPKLLAMHPYYAGIDLDQGSDVRRPRRRGR